MPNPGKISIDTLIEIVNGGGSVKTGMDVYNKRGILLLEKDVMVKEASALELVKNAGITHVPINVIGNGGLWDGNGNQITFPREASPAPPSPQRTASGSIGNRIRQINEIKKQAAEKHEIAKSCIRKVLDDIKTTGGEFDYKVVEGVVTDILDFLAANENGFSYLTREIFTYDDYLYNHSINVCTIATAALQKFNRSFSSAVNLFLNGLSLESLVYGNEPAQESFVLFNEEEIRNITIGFFLHDVGKVAIPGSVLNKQGPLNSIEYDLIRLHSYEKGQEILEKNSIQDPFVKNIVKYHHCTLYKGEPLCYPENLSPSQVPPYVKVCKLADMFDAMTSRRCYKEAFNPVSVVTDLFRKYANKDRLLQFIVDSFVRTVGIYPAGSVVHLRDGQKAYVLDSEGPIVIPFTSREGMVFRVMQEPMDLKEAERRNPEFGINRRAALASPAEAYESLPHYLKEPIRLVSSR
jgi:HD-GYP domain-containing protein (c-di-GMP phosphodiesterase class II)